MKQSKIKIQITCNNFSEEQKEAMWQVYHRYYHYSRKDFMQRILRNNYYAMYTADNHLVGFTGLRINRIKNHEGRKFLIYFGQTIIDHSVRGKSLLPKTAAKLVFRFFGDIITSKVYFWADCLTYKAYLVFAKTVAEYYPTYKRPNPTRIQQLIDRIGMMNYKDTYCPKTGTVKKSKVLVNDNSTLTIRPEYQQDPDVHYYHTANPNYINGNGLITLAPIHWKNIKILIHRLILGKPKKSAGSDRQLSKEQKIQQEVTVL